jgi:hypothetical protein
MDKIIENERKVLLADIWANHKQFLRMEKVCKADIIDYVCNKIEPFEDLDNMFYYAGYFRALEAVENAMQRSDIRQGRNEI